MLANKQQLQIYRLRVLLVGAKILSKKIRLLEFK